MQTPFIHSYYMQAKKHQTISFAAIAFLLIIVLQYVENKSKEGKYLCLSVIMGHLLSN